jgi:hypothetical protein
MVNIGSRRKDRFFLRPRWTNSTTSFSGITSWTLCSFCARQLPELLYGTVLVNLMSFLHLRLSSEKAFAGTYHGSGESRAFQLKSGHPL